MSRPPSQAVIEAVERAERDHRVAIYPGRSATRLRCRTCDRFVSEDHCLAEIARAAEQAADEKWMRWLIEQLHYGIDTSCEVDPPCTLADYAAMWERIDPREKHMAEVIVAETGAWADELTDTDDRSMS